MRTLETHKSRQSTLRRFRKHLALRHLVDHADENRAQRGQDLVVLANDWVGSRVALDVFYERRELEALMSFLRPLQDLFSKGDVLDIGANIGNHSVFFARFFARVCAFEPNPLAFRMLELNAELSGAIDPYPFGLGSQCGHGRLVGCEGNMGAMRLELDNLDADSKNLVAIHALDELALPFNDIQLIKIDVEGAEHEVLLGARETLRKEQPIIVFEQLQSAFDCNETETPAVAFLRAEGYHLCWFESPKTTGSAWKTRWNRLVALCTGIHRLSICTGEVVPRADHSLLIAVPDRHSKALSL